MSQTTSVPLAFQSIKSLPTNNPNPGLGEKHGNAKLRSTDVNGSNGRENVALVVEVSKKAHSSFGDMDLFDEDSPYGENGESFEDRPFDTNEDSVSVSLPLPSVSTSSRESRWSDTTHYASKKVTLASDYKFSLLLGFEISLLYPCLMIINQYSLLVGKQWILSN